MNTVVAILAAALMAQGAAPPVSPGEVLTGKGLLWACRGVVSSPPQSWDFQQGHCLGQLTSLVALVGFAEARAGANFQKCNEFCQFVNSKSPISPPAVCADVCDVSRNVARWPICLPAQTSMQDLARVVVVYLEAHPAEHAKSSTTVAFDALAEKFPCKP